MISRYLGALIYLTDLESSCVSNIPCGLLNHVLSGDSFALVTKVYVGGNIFQSSKLIVLGQCWCNC
jgi:hypothetical protein